MFHKLSEAALFGAYSGADYALIDETTILTAEDWHLFVKMRAKYDSPGMRRMLLDVDRIIESPGFNKIKSDRTTTVGTTSRDGKKLLIKRYNTKNHWHAVRRVLRRSRAQNCFEFACELLQLGVATAPPVAYLEARLGPLKGRSWLITEYVEGIECLKYVNEQASTREIGEIAARLERMFQKLAKANITHGDMKATNYILQNDCDPVLLDLDGMTRHGNPARYEAAHDKDKARFMKNWQSRPDIKACFSRVNW